MGYELLAKTIELTGPPIDVDRRLRKVARLLVESLPFDQCVLYSWDRRARVLRLRAYYGARKGLVKEYGDGRGFPGIVKKTGKEAEAYTRGLSDIRAQGVEDLGLEGYRYGLALPLRDGLRWYGVMYLKSRSKVSLSPRKRKLLSIVALQIASVLRCEELFQRLSDAYKKLKNLQMKVLNVEKLLPVAEMAASLAHEIRSPLISIGGLTGRLKKRVKGDPECIPYVENILKEVARLEEIMQGIINISEKKGFRFERLDIDSVIDESLKLFDDVCRAHDITIIRDRFERPLEAVADRQQLKIAFDNIITNAVQSMGEGGTLRITTYRNSEWVVADFSDTGGGVDPSITGKIFDPFFTTKEYGTGLGLTITSTIISNHKGCIRLKNRKGKGATFSIRLPLAGGRAAEKNRGRIQGTTG